MRLAVNSPAMFPRCTPHCRRESIGPSKPSADGCLGRPADQPAREPSLTDEQAEPERPEGGSGDPRGRDRVALRFAGRLPDMILFPIEVQWGDSNRLVPPNRGNTLLLEAPDAQMELTRR